MNGAAPVGVVTSGSLTKGLKVRLQPGSEAILGQYVMAPLDGGGRLLGMVTDLALEAAEPRATAWPPPAGEDPGADLLREVLLDTAVYTALEMTPYLEVDVAGGGTARARRLPRHFVPVYLADQETVVAAFETGGQASVHLGAPLGMEQVELCVDFERLFERSAGIFGKSGTGKTVVALELLTALVAHSSRQKTAPEKTVALVFDMHNDFGEWLKFEGGQRRSLKTLHPSDVALYTLDEKWPGGDGRIVIGTRDIEPEDLDVLQATTEFSEAAMSAVHTFHQRLGRDWLDGVLLDQPSARLTEGLDEDDANWNAVCTRLGVHHSAFQGLRRRLRDLCRPAFVQEGEKQEGIARSLETIVQTLQKGTSVVVQFGRYGRNESSYMLVANMLSRRIWDKYRDAVEEAIRDPGRSPNRLVIVIEEAHRFMHRSMAGKSIFGEIARELRKYNVTLLVIDQRPSQIDSEVLSQIGTRFCLQLDSDADVEALIGGVAGRASLRQVIATLESQQQALVFGHALAMPVVLRTPELTADFKPGATLRDRLAAGTGEPAAPPLTLYGRRSLS